MIELALRIRTVVEWSLAWNANERVLSVPTTQQLTAGEPAHVKIDSPLAPDAVVVAGIVDSWQPAVPRRRQRAMAKLSLSPDQASKVAMLGEPGVLATLPRRRHPRYPTSLPARLAFVDQSAAVAVEIVELSRGGCCLGGGYELVPGTRVSVEVVAPGASSAMKLQATVRYFTVRKLIGLAFDRRQGAAQALVDELLRRVTKA